MATTASYKCKNCQKSFRARTADRARGWAKCCSKSCAASLREATTVKTVHRRRPWQRFDLCQSRDDEMDLVRHPYIIAPLYEDGERAGELFYAGNEPWDDRK